MSPGGVPEPPRDFLDEAVRELGVRRRQRRWWRGAAAVDSLTLRDVLVGCARRGEPVAVTVADVGLRHGLVEAVGQDVVVLARPAGCELIAWHALVGLAVDRRLSAVVAEAQPAGSASGPTLLGELEERVRPGEALGLWCGGQHRLDASLVAVGDDLVTVRAGGRLHHVAAAGLGLVACARAGR